MTLGEAIESMEALLDWYYEGQDDPPTPGWQKDVDILEFSLELLKRLRKQMMDLATSSNMTADHTTKEVYAILKELIPNGS